MGLGHRACTFSLHLNVYRKLAGCRLSGDALAVLEQWPVVSDTPTPVLPVVGNR
jgi:hypothetical protein